jgi:tetratricopeptide (TPR) repeat protein
MYDAFISYSHARDKPIASALQASIQRLGKRWYWRRALRVFRDDTSLSASPGLWPKIEQALADSRYLIVLASPASAASPWVQKEIAYWLREKSAETLLIGLTDGDLPWDASLQDFRWSDATPLPPELKGRFVEEPRWVDLRPCRDGTMPRDAKFTELAADFAAAIHGVPKEDLLSQEVRQQRRALTLAWSAASTLLVLAAAAGWFWWNATIATRTAELERARAEKTLAAAVAQNTKLISATLQDYRHATGIGSQAIRRILDNLVALQSALVGAGNNSPDMELVAAGALEGLVSLNLDLGDQPKALKYVGDAKERLKKLVNQYSGNLVYRHQLAMNSALAGDVLALMDRPDEALVGMREALDLLKSLQQPNNKIVAANLTVVSFRIGDILVKKHDYEQGLLAYDESEPYANEALRLFPDDLDMLRNKSAVMDGRCGALRELKRYVEAVSSCGSALEMSKRLVAGSPNHTNYQWALVVSHGSLAKLLNAVGRRDEAVENYKAALTALETLADLNGDNVFYQEELARLEILLSGFEEADARRSKATEVLIKLDRDGKISPLMKRVLDALRREAARE